MFAHPIIPLKYGVLEIHFDQMLNIEVLKVTIWPKLKVNLNINKVELTSVIQESKQNFIQNLIIIIIVLLEILASKFLKFSTTVQEE